MIEHMVGRGAEAVGERFRSAEEAWFWTCGALRGRREGSRSGSQSVKRPCEPDDVVLCLERLLRTGRIDREHATVLGLWGFRQQEPSAWSASHRDRMLWSDAMTALGAALSAKNVLVPTDLKEYIP